MARSAVRRVASALASAHRSPDSAASFSARATSLGVSPAARKRTPKRSHGAVSPAAARSRHLVRSCGSPSSAGSQPVAPRADAESCVASLADSPASSVPDGCEVSASRSAVYRASRNLPGPSTTGLGSSAIELASTSVDAIPGAVSAASSRARLARAANSSSSNSATEAHSASVMFRPGTTMYWPSESSDTTTTGSPSTACQYPNAASPSASAAQRTRSFVSVIACTLARMPGSARSSSSRYDVSTISGSSSCSRNLTPCSLHGVRSPER